MSVRRKCKKQLNLPPADPHRRKKQIMVAQYEPPQGLAMHLLRGEEVIFGY
jgi:hypothetical protein